MLAASRLVQTSAKVCEMAHECCISRNNLVPGTTDSTPSGGYMGCMAELHPALVAWVIVAYVSFAGWSVVGVAHRWGPAFAPSGAPLRLPALPLPREGRATLVLGLC